MLLELLVVLARVLVVQLWRVMGARVDDLRRIGVRVLARNDDLWQR